MSFLNMLDFTINTYEKFLQILMLNEYSFQTYADFIQIPATRVVLLRHDVDAKKENALKFARIQHKMGIHGTYYFRIVPQSYNERVISEIANLGHEIGYHYETMDSAYEKSNNEVLVDAAYQQFCKNLDVFRKIVPIKTICMHGSPRSKYDNKAIWEKYSYKSLGIIGEPYFDIDFNAVLYLTDTGRRWDGNKVSVRDKITIPEKFKHIAFRSTKGIIDAVGRNTLPDKVMFTFHPQRWTDNPFEWSKEIVFQNSKNLVKKYFFVKR